MKVKQLDSTELLLRPGDILWRRCSNLKYSTGSNVELDSSIIALMYLGEDPALGRRLAFTVCSVRVGSLSLEGNRYNITVNGNKIRVTLGTIKSAISKMRNLVSPTHVCMNNKSRSGRSYIIKQEIFITSQPNMALMQFEKSGLRIVDMRQWPWYSIRWWGKWVLGLKTPSEYKVMTKYKTNGTLVSYLRKMTASSGNKKNVRGRKAKKHAGDLWPSDLIDSLQPGLLPSNVTDEYIPDTPIGEDPAIKDVITYMRGTSDTAGIIGGIRWVKFTDPAYRTPYYIELRHQEFPSHMLTDSVVIFDHKIRPIYVTAAKTVQHPSKAILRVDDANGASIGLWVISYKDGLISWLLRGDAGNMSSLAVDFNELEEEPLLEAEPADTDIRITSYYTNEGVELRVEYNAHTGVLHVFTRDNDSLLLNNVISTGKSMGAVDRYLGNRNWVRRIEEASEPEEAAITLPHIRMTTYRTRGGTDLRIKYNVANGEIEARMRGASIFKTVINTDKSAMAIMKYLDLRDWARIIECHNQNGLGSPVSQRITIYRTSEGVNLRIQYDMVSGDIEARISATNQLLDNTRIQPGQNNRAIRQFLGRKNWARRIAEASGQELPPVNLNERTIQYMVEDGSTQILLDIKYSSVSGRLRVFKDSNCIMDTSRPRGLIGNTAIFEFMDSYEWTQIISQSDLTSPPTPPHQAIEIRHLAFTTPSNERLRADYTTSSGRITVRPEGSDSIVLDTHIIPEQSDAQVLDWMAGENWSHLLSSAEEPALDHTIVSSQNNGESYPMTVTKEYWDGSKLVASYHADTGRMKVVKFKAGWVPGDRVKLVIQTIAGRGMSEEDVLQSLNNINTSGGHV